MTEAQKELVQSSFEQVIPISEQVADQFYTRLFELAPEVRPLFKGNIKAQGIKLMELLTYAISSLDNLEELVPAVRDLAKRHVAYGVQDAHYAVVGEALIWVLAKNFGDAFTDELKDAWVAVYTLLANTMIDASK